MSIIQQTTLTSSSNINVSLSDYGKLLMRGIKKIEQSALRIFNSFWNVLTSPVDTNIGGSKKYV